MFEQALDLAKPLVEQAEVYELREEITPATFEANRLKEIQTKRRHGLAVRVIKNGRVGLASSTDLRDLPSLIDRAIASAEFGAPAAFQFPRYVQAAGVAVYDPALEKLSAESLIDLGWDMIDRVRNYDPDILCSATVSKSLSTVTLANTQGEQVSYAKTVNSVSLSGNLITGTDMLDISEEASSCRADINVERLVSDLVDKFDVAKRVAEVRTKPMPVVFTPKGVAGALLLPLKLALNGRVVLQGASPLGDKVGREVFDSRISMYDDGTVSFAPRSADVDDEGVPTRRTTLVEGGQVQGFIFDLQTGALANKESTGNGFRSLDTLPAPAFSSFIFAEGDTLLLDMIEDVKEGVLIDQVMGAWAGNLLGGELSGNIHLGFKIENGVLAGRVKDAMVAGNVYDAFRTGLAALGSENTWVDGSAFVPPMYFRALSIATKRA